jgi:hypothetical protein
MKLGKRAEKAKQAGTEKSLLLYVSFWASELLTSNVAFS